MDLSRVLFKFTTPTDKLFTAPSILHNGVLYYWSIYLRFEVVSR